MATKNVVGVEIRFSSPINSLQDINGERRVAQFKSEYILKLDDGSAVGVAGHPTRSSSISNTPEFACAVYYALSG
jgi:hypothetical protein